MPETESQIRERVVQRLKPYVCQSGSLNLLTHSFEVRQGGAAVAHFSTFRGAESHARYLAGYSWKHSRVTIVDRMTGLEYPLGAE